MNETLPVESSGKNKIVDPIRNKHIKVDRIRKPKSRGVSIAKHLDNALEQWKLSQPITKWKKSPGEKGFNKYANKMMKRAKLEKKLKLKCDGSSFAYQDTVSFCLHPSTTIDRLLVIHRTGSGKTRTMIKVLDNYYFDLRPKVLIFPTQEVTNNFYLQLMSFDNKFSQVVKAEYPNIEQRLNNRNTYNKALAELKDFLAMKGKLGSFKQGINQTSPLRAYSYSVAGGNSIFKGTRPNDPIFKLNFVERGHEYSNKIILMDEFHNLISPSVDLMKYKPKLMKLKHALKNAKNSIIGGFTATPIVDGLEKGKELLEIVKGGRSGNNEGYISYFNDLPRAIYPKIIISKMYIDIKKASSDSVKLKKSSKPKSNFEYYARAYLHRPEPNSENKAKKEILKLCNYINMGSYYTQVRLWEPFLKKDPKKWATKMYHVIKDIEKHKQKSLILIHRRAGFKGLVLAFKLISKADMFPNCTFCFTKAYDKEDSKNIKEFSKPNNLNGNKIKIFIADSSQFGEGVSFLGVRQLYLFNPALNFSEYLQLRGRVIRACASHNDLPREKRDVTINICIGNVPKPLKSVDNFLMKKLDQEEEKYNSQMKFFRNLAIDRKLLKRFFKKTS